MKGIAAIIMSFVMMFCGVGLVVWWMQGSEEDEDARDPQALRLKEKLEERYLWMPPLPSQRLTKVNHKRNSMKSPWDSDYRTHQADMDDLRSERSTSAPPPETSLLFGRKDGLMAPQVRKLTQ